MEESGVLGVLFLSSDYLSEENKVHCSFVPALGENRDGSLYLLKVVLGI